MPARAQDASSRIRDVNNNAWFMYFGDHPVGGKWGVHLEGQVRRHEFADRWQQLLLRPGINYALNDSTMLTAGYAFVKTHSYGDFPARFAFPEHRIFQQLLLKHRSGRVGLQHRYRLEQRYIGQMRAGDDGKPRVDSWRYQNRFRYFFKAAVPLEREGKWFLALYDEIFVNFAPNTGASIFDQNRAYGAIGYDLGKAGKLEVGYLNQSVAQRNGRVLEFNHTFQLAFFSTLPFGR